METESVSAVLERIVLLLRDDGPKKFWAILTRLQANDEKVGERLVDRALQKGRRAKTLTFDTKLGWSVAPARP